MRSKHTACRAHVHQGIWKAAMWLNALPTCPYQQTSTVLFLLASKDLSFQFSHSVLSDSATPWTEARHASLSITDSGQVHATFAYNHKNSFWDTKKPLFYPEMYFCSLQHFSFNILASPKCVLWNINPVEY